MRRLLILVLSLVGVGIVILRSEPDPFYLGGIQVNEPDHRAWVEALAESGFNTVAITVYAKQGDWDSADLWFEEEEPWVVGEAVVAKEHGLHVVLVLRVALDHAFERNKFFWHGMIMPSSDAQVDEWFGRYGSFVEKWARIAEDVGIDVVAIGSELNALTSTLEVDEVPELEEYWSNPEKVAGENDQVLEHREVLEERKIWVRGNDDYEALEPFLADRSRAHAQWARRVAYLDEAHPLARINRRRTLLEAHWIALVDRVREVYSGSLTYAANFDQYRSVGFWDRLDMIGINAYFPLRRRAVPDAVASDRVELFRSRWSTILHEIDAFRRRRGVSELPVLFSELGYVDRANCTIQPWAAHGFAVVSTPSGPQLMIWEDQPRDPTERADAVEGLLRASREFDGSLPNGILYWKLTTDPSHADIEPFALVIGDRAPQDPLLDVLRRFDSWLPFGL